MIHIRSLKDIIT